MPGDATHVRSAKGVAIVAAVVLLVAGVGIINVFGMVLVFMFAVMYLSPDLDLPNVAPVQRWGMLGRLWMPFEKIVPHRSAFSHGWILGVLTIDLYLLCIISFAIMFLDLCGMTLIEPTLKIVTNFIDDVLHHNVSQELTEILVLGYAARYAGHLHHKILDTVMKN